MSGSLGEWVVVFPAAWVDGFLFVVALFGVSLGLFSFFLPQGSIALYQRLMLTFHWKVDPLYPDREVRNTRALGVLLAALSAATLALLLVRYFAGY